MQCAFNTMYTCKLDVHDFQGIFQHNFGHTVIKWTNSSYKIIQPPFVADAAFVQRQSGDSACVHTAQQRLPIFSAQ